MEWTKENTRNTFIRFKTTKQKERAIAFYKELEYSESRCMKVYPNYKGEEVGTVYIEWNTMIFVSRTWTPAKERVEIKPFSKPRRKFPREMIVSNDEITWLKRTVFAKLKNKYRPYIICSPSGSNYKGFQFAKELPDMKEFNKRLPVPVKIQKRIIKEIKENLDKKNKLT